MQNSAGTQALKVTDDGAIDFGAIGLEFSNDGSGGTMSVASDRYVKIASSLNTYSALNAHVFKTLDGSAYSEAMRITGNTDQFVGIGESTPTARLHVKGSGNDNTTTSLLVQNSDGDDMMVLDDNKEVSFKGRSGFYNGVFIVENNHTKTQGNAIFGAFATPTARLQVKGSGATSATTALLVQNSAGTDMLKVQDDGVTKIKSDATAVPLYVNATGGTTGIEVQVQGNRRFRILSNNSLATLETNQSGGITTNGSLNVGGNAAADAGVRLQVKGSGATSATTALLVQNSAGTDMLKVQDDGNATFSGNTSSQRFYTNLGFYHSGATNNVLLPNITTGWVLQTANATGNVQVKNINVTASKETSASLQVDSTTQGFLPPRMTTTERDAISSPASGLMVYNTTTNKAQCYNGTAWQDLF